MGQMTTEDLVDRLTNAAVEVKQLISDVHTIRKGLRSDITEARQVIKDLKDAVVILAEEHIDKTVAGLIDDMGINVAEQMEISVKKIERDFTELSDILMGREEGHTPLKDLVLEMNRRGI